MNTQSTEDEIQFIRRIMSDTRAAAAEDGTPSAVIGGIVSLVLFLTYFEAITDTDLKAGWVWLILSLLGAIYITTSTRRTRVHRVHTLADRILQNIWFGCGVSICIIVCMTSLAYVLELRTVVGMYALCLLTATILGTAYLLHGSVTGMRWLRNLSIVWWLGAIMMFLWPSVHVLAIESVMILLCVVTPGIIMNRMKTRLADAGE
jgi:hypothetical protein